MRVFQSFDTQHSGVISDLVYDYYSKRVATCSSGEVKIWDYQDDHWECTGEISGSDVGAVTKVCWAHPEYGQIIATCSLSGTVNIYEEIQERGQSWEYRASLDHSFGVSSMSFAPRNFGLILATISSDGIIRLYQATDVTDLSHWELREISETEVKQPINCIEWDMNSNFGGVPKLAVNGPENTVLIMEYREAVKRWVAVVSLDHDSVIRDIAWAPQMGKTYHLIAVATNDNICIWSIKNIEGRYEEQQVAVLDDHKAAVGKVEWNITGTILSSSGDDGIVRLWKQDIEKNWFCYLEINPNT
eukprot:TRINITY_DN1977_c0_g2_i1.p1 TRINITY_DN1977_c0_g2~~TRINITY_DN1977_c0_g2_i1.p1  ORF type:complete len:302 (+),score=75.67 TRINITY_DN1977_c0_g2_i1:48-953(+)